MTALRISCPKTLDQHTGRDLLATVRERFNGDGVPVVLDLADTESMDSRGGAWLVKISKYVRSKEGELHCEGHAGSVADFIDLIGPALALGPEPKKRHENIFEEIGEKGYSAADEVRDFANLVVDAVYWTFIGPFEGRGFRWNLLTDELYEMGVHAIKINTLMNFLLGLIIAMLSAAQLRQVGLDIYVADLTIIAFARELAAVMTAVVVAARTGAAITAELATMTVQEEIDALRGMGLKVPQFLVAPKILALLIVMPCITALGMVAGVLGGAAWGIPILGIEPVVWFRETINAADLGDAMQGLLKSLCFALTIVLVGCHNGLRVKGGSRGVGLMTTRAVVMDIFAIIVIDMIFAAIFYYVL